MSGNALLTLGVLALSTAPSQTHRVTDTLTSVSEETETSALRKADGSVRTEQPLAPTHAAAPTHALAPANPVPPLAPPEKSTETASVPQNTESAPATADHATNTASGTQTTEATASEQSALPAQPAQTTESSNAATSESKNPPNILGELPSHKETTSTKPIETKMSAGDELSNTLWQAGGMAVLMLAGLAVGGFALVRWKNKSTTFTSRVDKPLQIVSALPLSPKRQVILLRVRDQEILVSSTEQGVTLLTEVGKTQISVAENPRVTSQSRAPLLSRAQAPSDDEEQPKAALPRTRGSREEPKPLAPQSEAAATDKSHLLMGALKNLKAKAASATHTGEATAPSSAEKNLNGKTEMPEKVSPALRQTKGAFPKYLAATFEQESKRELAPKREEAPAADNQEDSVESVTRMIREKLKGMQPTG